jgi:hypothetical protein
VHRHTHSFVLCRPSLSLSQTCKHTCMHTRSFASAFSHARTKQGYVPA